MLLYFREDGFALSILLFVRRVTEKKTVVKRSFPHPELSLIHKHDNLIISPKITEYRVTVSQNLLKQGEHQ